MVNATQIVQALLSLLDNNYLTGQILYVDGGEAVSHVGSNTAIYQRDMAARKLK